MNDESNVIPVAFKKTYSVERELVDGILAVVYGVSGFCSVGTAIGVLEIVKQHLISEQMEQP